MDTDKKIKLELLPGNKSSLASMDLLPGDKISIDQNLLDQITIHNSKANGYYGAQRFEGLNETIGSKYDNSRNINKILSKYDFGLNTFYYIIGFGLGDLIDELIKKLSRCSKLICIEPYPELFYKVCEKVDFAHFLNDHRFELVLQKDLKESMNQLSDILKEKLAMFNKVTYIKSNFLTCFPSFDIVPWEESLGVTFSNAIKMNVLDVATTDASIKNYFINSIDSLKQHDWEHFFSRLQGKVLLVLGIGPSLALNIQYIKELQEHCYIACVDNALREVLSNNIVPDIVFHLDWQSISKGFFSELDIPDSVTLIYNAGVDKKVLDFWPGPKLSYRNWPIADIFENIFCKDLPPSSATNVGAMAFQVAMVSKAHCVYLIGYDLCSPLGSYYHPNAMHLWDVYPNASRYSSLEKFDLIFNKQNKEHLEVKGDEESVYWTTVSMEDSRKVMSDFIKLHNGETKIYNVSKYGLPVQGVPYADLSADINKIKEYVPKLPLSPSQNILDNSVILSICAEKKRELKVAYRVLHEIFLAANEFLEGNSSFNKTKYKFLQDDVLKRIDKYLLRKELHWFEK